MFTKILQFACLLFFVIACAKEDVQPVEPVKVKLKGEDGNCISEFGQNFSRFQNGEATDAEVEAFWACMQKAVSDFQRLTVGDLEGGHYSPQAIRGFLQRNFLRDTEINDQLLSSLMEIKRVLLGGSAQQISKDELVRAHEFLGMVRQMTLKINPSATIAFARAENASDEQIHIAGEVIQRSLQNLGFWLSQRGQDYSFAQIESFLRELQSTSEKPGLLKFGSLIAPIKQILLSGSEVGIKGSEWEPLMASLADAYRAWLGVNYAFSENLNAAMARALLPKSILFAVNALERGTRSHQEQRVPIAEWNRLFEAVVKTDWLGEEFSAESLMHAFKWFLERPLANQRSRASSALTMGHLKVLRTRLEEWSTLHQGIAGAYTGPLKKDFEQFLSVSHPLEWDSKGRMLFAKKIPSAWSDQSQAHLLWCYTLIKWLKEAYVGKEVDHLTGDDMVTAAEEILSVLHKFGWMLETQSRIGSKLLRESDLFTSASNGNGQIDVNEGSRYLAFVASGFLAAKDWLSEADKDCGDRDATCVRKIGGEYQRDILGSMPRLKEWLQDNPDQGFKVYVNSAEAIALSGLVEGEFSTGDLMQVWIVFQYIETFLDKYDRDSTQTINLSESDPAYALFGPTLGMLLNGLVSEDELFGFFTFMLKYGDTPFTMYGGQVAYLHWRWHRNDWSFEADRKNLMGILYQLSQM